MFLVYEKVFQSCGDTSWRIRITLRGRRNKGKQMWWSKGLTVNLTDRENKSSCQPFFQEDNEIQVRNKDFLQLTIVAFVSFFRLYIFFDVSRSPVFGQGSLDEKMKWFTFWSGSMQETRRSGNNTYRNYLSVVSNYIYPVQIQYAPQTASCKY